MSIDFKTLVPQGLELLGSALTLTGVGAPAGAALAGIGELVGHILGVPPTPENLQTAIQGMTPDQQSALLTLQENTKQQLQQQVLASHVAELTAKTTAEQAELADVASARSRQTETKDNYPNNLMTFITVGFFGLLALLIFKDIPPGSQAVVNVMTGSLGTAWIAGVSYYFGTTRGSELKNGMLANVQTALSGHLDKVTSMLGVSDKAANDAAAIAAAKAA